ncbi:MAG TPA: hypothetical protein VIC85_09940 [Ktedonobacterales bacterium]|jgi:hypothetical protein
MMTRLQRMAAGTWARRLLAGAGGALLLTLALAACDLGGNAASGPSATLTLAQVPWCDGPSIHFQDDGKLQQPDITDWQAVKGQLGFTPYLPATLPRGTCLALAGGTIHDPVLGAQFRITYVLPGSAPLSFSEAPQHAASAGGLGTKLQCSQAIQPRGGAQGGTPIAGATPSPTAAVVTVCLGAQGRTSITIAAASSSDTLIRMFNALQPATVWLPTSTTPSSTATKGA